MKALNLLGGTALALVMCGAVASAQMQQKGTEEKASPTQKQGSDAASNGQSEKGAQRTEPKSKSESSKSATGKSESGKSESGEKGTKGAERNKEQGKSSAQTQPKEQGAKGSEQGAKGSARTQPTDQGTKGAQTQPSETSRKGSAQTEPKEQKKEGSARTQPTDQTTKGAAKEGSAGRVQLSEQQRTNIHETILKEPNVNRINQVNFSINVGTRIPRSVRLVPLPASVISLVREYRGYRYFVANDEICIVDPNTYDIVEVIPAATRMARGEERGGARLSLTEQEKRIILDNLDLRGDSTLALGSLGEGLPVPRGARLETFPNTIVQEVPKVRGYKYFTTEDRVAIVDPQGAKIQLMIEAKR